jgi:hypothetical protein
MCEEFSKNKGEQQMNLKKPIIDRNIIGKAVLEHIN